MRYLLRYGEVGLKSPAVQRQMKRGLRRHIQTLLRREGAEGLLIEEEGRLFLDTAFEGVESLLPRVFGLVSSRPVEVTAASLPALTAVAVAVAREAAPGQRTFAVRVRRVGDHPFTSMDLARHVGREVLAALPDLQVDLTTPDWELFLEVRGEKAYVGARTIPGPGGLPLDTQGTVVAHVEGAEGLMAAWLMMKRGCRVLPVFLREDRWAYALAYWDPRSTAHRVEDLREMERIAAEGDAGGYVYPQAVPRGEETLRPAFFPLLGLPGKTRAALRERVLAPVGLA